MIVDRELAPLVAAALRSHEDAYVEASFEVAAAVAATCRRLDEHIGGSEPLTYTDAIDLAEIVGIYAANTLQQLSERVSDASASDPKATIDEIRALLTLLRRLPDTADDVRLCEGRLRALEARTSGYD